MLELAGGFVDQLQPHHMLVLKFTWARKVSCCCTIYLVMYLLN